VSPWSVSTSAIVISSPPMAVFEIRGSSCRSLRSASQSVVAEVPSEPRVRSAGATRPTNGCPACCSWLRICFFPSRHQVVETRLFLVAWAIDPHLVAVTHVGSATRCGSIAHATSYGCDVVVVSR
jgi:hypothetical protein